MTFILLCTPLEAQTTETLPQKGQWGMHLFVAPLYDRLLHVTTGYYRLLKVYIGYNWLLQFTTGYYNLLQVNTGYYMVFHVTSGHYWLLKFTTDFTTIATVATANAVTMVICACTVLPCTQLSTHFV